MADPYAERESGATGDRPAAAASITPLLEPLGGVAVATLGALGTADLGSARFVAVVRADQGPLPPLARVPAALAVALVIAEGDDAGEGAAALEVLEAATIPIFLVKEGVVAGPAGSDGAVEVEGATIAAVIEAALAGEVGWERDPDFSYEVAARVPESAAGVADAFCPRLLYAAADRVYEHAELVVAYKRAWHEKLDAIDGLEQPVRSASGWPIEPSGQSWKD